MQFLVDEPLAGARLDAALATAAPALSRAVARKLCALGAVAVDGVVGDGTLRLRPGSTVCWHDGQLELTLALGLPVVAGDLDFLVLHKPAGMAVHKGPLVEDSVAARLERAFAGAGSGLAQRLDRGASGLLLIGRHHEALRALAAAMERGAIVREYVAIAAGVLPIDERSIDLPLRATDEPRGNLPKVVVDHQHGLPARTLLTVLDRRADCSLLRLRLETGRTHQIRAHLRAIGHPLLGDPRYGDPAANASAHATFGIDRPLLHAVRLAFPHPRTGEPVQAQAFHAPDFARVFRALLQRPAPG